MPCSPDGYSFSTFSSGTEFVDWDNPTYTSEGYCKYDCGCLFPPGTISEAGLGYNDRPVYVETYRLVASEECEANATTTNDCDSEGVITLSYDVVNCLENRLVLSTGEWLTCDAASTCFFEATSQTGEIICGEKTVCILADPADEELYNLGIIEVPCSNVNGYPDCDNYAFTGSNDEYLLSVNPSDDEKSKDQYISNLRNEYLPNTISGIKKEQRNFKAIVFPNPFVNQLGVYIYPGESQMISYVIRDVAGLVIDSNQFLANINTNNYFSFPNLPSLISAGVYFLILEDENGNRLNFKIVKQ